MQEEKFSITYKAVELRDAGREMALYIHRGFCEADATPLALGLRRVLKV